MFGKWFKKTEQDFGNPLYNLRINLVFDKETFEFSRDKVSSDLYRIINLADIARFSLTNLEGAHLVTDCGALLKMEGIKEYSRYAEYRMLAYPWLDADLSVNENSSAMNRLIGAFSESSDDSKEKMLVELDYQKPLGFKQNMYAKQGRLWLCINNQNPLMIKEGVEAKDEQVIIFS